MPSPLKPWERAQSPGGSSLKLSSTVANGRNIPDGNSGTPATPVPLIGGQRTPSSTTTASSASSPSLPPRPSSASSGVGGYGSTYSRYGSGYGSSYIPRYGGYSSSYGNSYGGYGGGGSSSYYGNRYGSGSYGYGSSYTDRPPGGMNNSISKFGQMVDSFAHISHLLDANFDAVHGSLASLLRLMDVFGEFAIVIKSFAVFQVLFGSFSKAWAALNWVVGRVPYHAIQGGHAYSNAASNALNLTDFNAFQQPDRRRSSTLMLVLIVISFISAPMLFVKLWRAIRGTQSSAPAAIDSLENAWKDNGSNSTESEFQQNMVKALYDLRGEHDCDLSFRQGEIITVVSKPYPDWWEGSTEDGRRGLFPVNYVEVVKNHL